MTEGFIESTIQIEIPTFSEKYVNQKTVTFYVINCTNIYSNQKWSMEKEFDDFTQLEKNLLRLIPNTPCIEGKSIFKVTSYDGLTKRRFYLEQFLKECCTRKDILSNEYFKEFLDLERHSPELTYNTPVKLSEFNDLPLGIRDFIYLQNEGVVFIICSDMNIASRVDAYITNVNLPWESKTDTHISVGAFFAFKVKFDINKGFHFDKVFAKSFPEQTGVVNYDRESYTVNIGLDTGRIVFYKLNPESSFTQYEPYIDFRPHRARVMGLAYDAKTGYIYSCSSDKKFYITEINYLSAPSEVMEGPCGYTNLYYDRKFQRVFLTNEIGMVDVYLTQNFPPTLVNSIQTSTEYSIRGFDIDFSKYYIFTAAKNGQLCVLDLNMPGKERLIKEISNFGGMFELRVVRYHKAGNELITGDQDGRITIWSLKTGQSIYAWEAHEGAITQIVFLPEEKVIISAGKDKYFKAWKLPDKWINEEIRKFEEEEIKNMSDTMAMLKIQKALEKPEDYNSDEDSLNGWDYRVDLD